MQYFESAIVDLSMKPEFENFSRNFNNTLPFVLTFV